jgi:hypothetical protein
MKYEAFSPERFYAEVSSEEQARAFVWRAKCEGQDFKCPHCRHSEYYQYRTRPEVRVCRLCLKQVRLRADTIFASSKTSLLLWLKALFYMMEGKRGVSASELQRHLGHKSYGRVWSMLHKIREALQQRDDQYQLSGTLELDGAVFGRRETGNQTEVLVAVETKSFVNAKGQEDSRAGFAKIVVSPEKKVEAQAFVNEAVVAGSMVNTDGSPALRNLEGFDVDYQVVGGSKEAVNRWLPWVHRLIGNAKVWINGTHHGVEAKHLKRYLAEYLYRFNRRHDVGRMFHRALVACTRARPVRLCALC